MLKWFWTVFSLGAPDESRKAPRLNHASVTLIITEDSFSTEVCYVQFNKGRSHLARYVKSTFSSILFLLFISLNFCECDTVESFRATQPSYNN